VSDTPRMDSALRKAQEDCTESYLLTEGLKLERELNAANAEIRIFQSNIDRVMGMYASKDNQICNLLNICRANGIDVSSQDLIHGKEAK